MFTIKFQTTKHTTTKQVKPSIDLKKYKQTKMIIKFNPLNKKKKKKKKIEWHTNFY